MRDHLNRDDIRPLTDVIAVSSVETHAYAIDVTVFIQSADQRLYANVLLTVGVRV